MTSWREGSPSRRPSSRSNRQGLPSEPRASITASAPLCSSASAGFSSESNPPETMTGTSTDSTTSAASA